MARLSTYTKDVDLTGKDMLAGSNYVTTVNGIDQFETNNFTLKKLSKYFIEQINIDPGNLPLKSNGGLVYETTLDTDYLAIDLSATNITGQLANSDLVNSYITINGSNIELGGSIDIPIGDITSVIAGTYLNGGGTINDVTINHDDTSRSDTTSSPSQLAYDGTFTAITSVSTNATGHLTAINTATYTLPSSDETNDYVDSIAVTGTTTKTITLGRTGALSDLTATFDDNDTIPNDATITLSAGTYISGGGDFTTDQSANETITFNHDNTTRTDTTSSVGPNHGADFTVIDTLTSNATGHITAANVKTVTLPNGANDNTITLSAGTYLSGGGDFTVDQSFDETLTINHDATTRSDTTSTDNNNSHEDTFTVVDSISTNATGHVTGVNVKTVSFPSDTNQDIDVNVSNLETRLGQIGNTSIGSSGSTITIPNLTVTGTQTINNVEVISTSSGIVFEGTSNDANETTLNVINPTADRAINLPNKSGTVALTDDIETYDLSVSSSGTAASIDLDLVNSGGTDIVVVTGGGGVDVTLNSAQQFTISHTDTSSQSSVNNSGNTFIQDITVDTYGHITGITSGTATDNDTITQIREDNGSYRTGSITLQSGTNVNITEPSTGVFNFAATDTNTTYSAGGGLDLNGTVFSHTDTSSQSSVNNSGRTYIQDITLDTYGHVTGLTSATETVTDTNTTYDLAVPSGTTYVRLSGSDGTTDDILITGSGSTTVTRVSGSALQISSTDTDTNNYVTGASVTGTATKTLTLTRQGLSDVTASWTDLDTNTDTNYYLNTASFNTGNGVLSLGVTGYGTVTVDLDGRYLTSYTETDTLATVTSRGNTTGLLKVETGSLSESNAGTAGLIMNGNYTNGQYSHRWRKQDPGGNVPLYLDQSGPTANSYTWQARFGAYSGNSMTFEVNGSIKANGDMHSNRMYDNASTAYYIDPANGSRLSNIQMLNNTQISFDRGSGDFSTMIYATNHPLEGYTSSGQNYWMAIESKGGTHIILNTDGSYNSGENTYDHFTIWQDNIANYNARQFYVTNVGNVYAKGDVVAYQSSNMSDIRLKKDIKPIENALDIVDKLQGVKFTWKRDDKKSLGFIAQEVEKVVPELVVDRPAMEDPNVLHKTVNYSNMVAILTEAVKELSDKIKALENGSTK